MKLLSAPQLSKLTDQRLGAYRKMVRNRLSFYENGVGLSPTTPRDRRIDQLELAADCVRNEYKRRRTLKPMSL